MSEQIILNIAGVNKRFGGLQALTDVGIKIMKGQIYGLIGPNGAGKTTFFNVITGLYQPDTGTFELAGKPYSPSAPHEVAKAGIARTFQNIRLFGEMTALENVMVGRHVRSHQGVFGAVFRHKAARLEEASIRARAQELLDFVGIGQFANRTSKFLSYGDQRRLEIARALATDPQLLALDEPAAGMNATEKLALRELLVKIKARRQDRAADRARRQADDGPVRPHHRARIRQTDRRRLTSRHTKESGCDRSLSRRRA